MPVQFATLLIISAEPPTDTAPAVALVTDGAQTVAVSTGPTLENAISLALQSAITQFAPHIAALPLDRPTAKVAADALTAMYGPDATTLEA
jgi:hypothetical protein